MSKKFFYIFSVICILYSFTSQVSYAQTPTTGTTTVFPTTNPLTSQTPQDRIANLKIRAGAELDRRILALNNLITKLSTMKRLSTDQKTSFTSQIQAEISNLNTLKTKINADTDSVTLKTDVQSIVSSYRVFALFMPQLETISVSERMLTAIDQLTALVTKLQIRIQEAQSKGMNVTALQTLLTDLQNKITDAKTQANTANTTVMPLTPAGYPGNKTTLHSARTTLQTAYQDLKDARKDAETIIQGLKALKGATTKITGTPTIISPTPATPTK